MKPVTQQIAIAWVEPGTVPHVGTYRHDLGERPKMRDVLVPCASRWAHNGTAEDWAEAVRYARRQSSAGIEYVVLTYGMDMDDLLAAAKRDVAKSIPVAMRV